MVPGFVPSRPPVRALSFATLKVTLVDTHRFLRKHAVNSSLALSACSHFLRKKKSLRVPALRIVRARVCTRVGLKPAKSALVPGSYEVNPVAHMGRQPLICLLVSCSRFSILHAHMPERTSVNEAFNLSTLVRIQRSSAAALRMRIPLCFRQQTTAVAATLLPDQPRITALRWFIFIGLFIPPPGNATV